jgi:hypothetical protein
MDSIRSNASANRGLARLLRTTLLSALLAIAVAISVCISAPPAMAGGVTYTFSGTNSAAGGDGLSVAFSYTAPAFVTSSTSLLSSQLNSCTNCVVSTELPTVSLQPANGSWDTIDFNDANGEGTAYAFPVGSLKTPGTYTSVAPFNPGTLTVSVATTPTIHVPGDQPTIQAAINAATTGYTVLVAPGTYTENINFLGKAITVTSANGPATTIIDGGAIDTVVTFKSGETAQSVLNGFTITNGFSQFTSPSGNFASGGGIFVSNASPTITSNIITKNKGCDGDGISITQGSPLIQGNTITLNVQAACSGGNGGGGIGILGASTSQILGNTIANNINFASGGGISMNGAGTPLIQNNTISGNSGGNSGGGIAMINSSAPQIIQNVIIANQASQGGGVFWEVPAESPGIFLLNNTILDNNASEGSEIDAGVFAGQALENNIIVGQSGTAAVYCANINNVVPPVFTTNDVFNSNGSAYGSSCGTATGTGGNISVDPLFVNPSAGNFHLQPGSPAINAGTTGVAQLPATDFAGNSRIVGTTIDLGAYEYQGLTAIQLSSPNLNFLSQTVGVSSSPLPLQLTNTGSTVLQISNISSSGYFSQTDNCLAVAGIAVGQSCQINVVFTPLLPGSQSGQLTITSNVGGSPQSVPLSGNGVSIAAAGSPNLGTLRNDFTGWVGMKITVGNPLLSVTALARAFAPGNSGSHVVKIVDASTGKDVPGASTTIQMARAAAGSFIFADLPASVVLNPNSSYYILSHETQGGDEWYDFNTTVLTTNDFSDVSAVWSGDGINYNLIGGIDQSYGPVSFLYNIGIIPSPPVITNQPQNQTVSTNGTATFTVAATGSNLTYQWWSAPSGSSTFSPITGATLSSYTISPAIQADSGAQFQCVVTNSLGTATSNAAVLTILNFTNYVTSTHLGTLRSNYSGWVGMSVAVGNTPITVVGLGRMFAPGNTGSHTVEIVNASNGQVVSGGFATMSLSGGTPGAFVYADLPATVTLNANTIYYIVSQETYGGDQWYDLNTTIDTATIATEVGAVYSTDGINFIPNGSAGESYGPVDFLYTENITFPAITAEPQSATVSVGATATFSVSATGGGLSYQWYSAPQGGQAHDFTEIAGATSSTYTIPSVTLSESGTQYFCLITNSKSDASSNIASLTVVAGLPTTNYVTSATPGTLRNNFTGWVGMALTIGSTPISVTELGRMVAPGNSGTHALKIVTASGSDVAGGATRLSTTGSGSGGFLYANLGSPVTLQANTTYYIVSQETQGGDQWYDINTSIQTSGVALETSGIWSPDGANYSAAGTTNTEYGPLDFQYTVPATSASLVTTVKAGALRNNFAGWVGATITTGANPLQVTQLGRYFVSGNSGTHILKLVNASNGADVAGGSVSVNLSAGQTGSFVYGTLSSPVTLNPNAVYYLVSQETQGGDQWFDINTAVQTTSDAADTAGVWSPDGVAYNQNGGANQMYVPVTFIYTLP